MKKIKSILCILSENILALCTINYELIASKIYLIRGIKVILDRDLAELYGVETRSLIQAVKRNIERFPPDFMLRLTKEEFDSLRSQIVISKGKGGRRYLPYVFSEQGVAMLSSVLKSKRAIEVNIAIICAFVQLRKTLDSHAELARKLADLEKRFESHDEQIQAIFEVIRQLMAPPDKEVKKNRVYSQGKTKSLRQKVKKLNCMIVQGFIRA